MSQETESKYAQKVKSGKQMYGPGCCAHRLTHVQIDNDNAKVPFKFLPRFTDKKTLRKA